MQKRLSVVCCAVLLGWLLVFCFQTGSLIVNAYNPLPEVDYWETVPHLDGYRHFPPAVLWEQHYEHRVIFPELVFAFDWMVLNGREVLPSVLTAALDIAVWIVLVLAYRTSGNSSGPAMWCALFLAGIVMSWPGVAFVLAFPFSLQFLLFQFSATATLWALSRKRLGWAVGLASVATFSSANGLFVWPVLIFLGWSVGIRRSRLLAIGGIGAGSAAIFFAGYRNIGNTHPELILSHTGTFFGYFLSYLGMPFGAAGTVTGLAAGAFSLVLLASIAVLSWGREEGKESIAITCFGICLLTLTTALITTASRLPMDGRPFEQAIVIPGRYVNFAAHYWGALSLLLVWMAAQIRPKFAWAGVLCLAGFFAATLLRTDAWVKTWMGFYAGYQYATLAIESGLENEEMGRVLNYADGSLVTRSVAELKRRHLSLYSWDRYQLVGKPLDSLAGSGRLGPELPPEQITAVQAVPGGVRIVGWANRRADLIVVDGLGKIAGLGRHLPAGETSGITVPAGHADDYWVAFAAGSFHREQARYFLLK